jgi:Ser-tRNA(Ala) deacylase AlaX
MTTPLYLHNAYLKEAEGTLLEITKETDQKWQIVLDQSKKISERK